MDATDLIFAVSIGMIVVIALSATGLFDRRRR
ncbi:hypothetical protein FB462_1467 [Curtobacterium citreum]|nr:hypothetical protein FB462_1467 [Curtobacterium citreum]